MTQFVYRCGCCNDMIRVDSDIDLNGVDLSQYLLTMVKDKRVNPKIPRMITHKCSGGMGNGKEVGVANLVGVYYRNDFSGLFY